MCLKYQKQKWSLCRITPFLNNDIFEERIPVEVKGAGLMVDFLSLLNMQSYKRSDTKCNKKKTPKHKNKHNLNNVLVNNLLNNKRKKYIENMSGH